jgi:capsular polysaccharide biosynthesis protein
VVSFRDTNPELARDYVNTLVRRYIAEDLSGKKEDTSEARQLLSGQVQLFKNKIDAIEAVLVGLNTGNNVYVVDDEARINEKLIPLQTKLDGLSVTYTNDYPEVIAVKAEIRHLQEQLQDLRTRDVANKNRATAQNGSGKPVENAGKKRLDLERERDTYKKIYEELVVRLSQSEVSQQIGPTDRSEKFSIAEPAVLPTKPVSPDRVKVILMGIFAGLAGGIGIIVFLDAMDHSVKSSKAIRTLGLPILAIIPKIQSDQQVQREKIRDSILYGMAVLYLLCILAIVAVEAMGLTYADTVAHQSVGAGKSTVKGNF